MPTGAKGGGAKKIGRNAIRCKQYKVENRRERNKLKRLRAYIERNKAMVLKKAKKGRDVCLDLQAQNALKRLTT